MSAAGGEVVIREASAEELDAVASLQRAVFSAEQGIPAEEVADFLNRQPRCWCAWLDGALVGAAAAWPEDGRIHWGRFAVRASCRGRQIGTRLARQSLRDLFDRGADEIFMEARETTVHIMETLGGVVVGDPVPFYRGTVTPVAVTRERFDRFAEKRAQPPR